MNEISKAIDSFASEKVPGIDGISPGIVKNGRPALTVCSIVMCSFAFVGKWVVCHHHHSIQDQGLINNYRGFSLLSIVGKVFGRVAVSHLQCLSSQFTLSNSAGSDLAGQQLCE